MTLSCVLACESVPLCVASCLSIFKSACIALTFSKRAAITSAVALLCTIASMVSCNWRCYSQVKSRQVDTSWCFYSVDIIIITFFHMTLKWLSYPYPCIYAKYMLIWNAAFQNVIKIHWSHEIGTNPITYRCIYVHIYITFSLQIIT